MNMSAIEIEVLARNVAEMAGRFGARIRLDYWKLRNLGLTETEANRIKDNLGESVDYGWPYDL